MLEVKNVVIKYGDKVLGPFDFTTENKEIIGIIGVSGAGKSSLIKAIAQNVEYEQGAIKFNNQPITKSHFTYISQIGTLFNHLTIKENLQLTTDLTSVKEVLQSLGLREEMLEQYPFQLSGGEKQRVNLARGILSKTNFLLLDETFSALDSKTKDEIYEVIKEMQKQYQMLIIIVTHDLLEAAILCDRIMLIKEGAIKYFDQVHNFINRDNEYLQELISPEKTQMLRSYYANV